MEPVNKAAYRDFIAEIGAEGTQAMFNLYLQELHELKHGLAATLADRDFAGLHAYCHMAKSSAATFGATALRQQMLHMDSLARQQDDAAWRHIAATRDLIDEAVSQLEGLLQSDTDN